MGSMPRCDTHRMQLFCTLKSHIHTADGDFIPAGTPVQVLQWTASGEPAIEVRVSAYMWSDREEHDGSEDFDGFVNAGLYVSVSPKKLKFLEMRSVKKGKAR